MLKHPSLKGKDRRWWYNFTRTKEWYDLLEKERLQKTFFKAGYTYPWMRTPFPKTRKGRRKLQLTIRSIDIIMGEKPIWRGNGTKGNIFIRRTPDWKYFVKLLDKIKNAPTNPPCQEP
jgi:hypothetical protein